MLKSLLNMNPKEVLIVTESGHDVGLGHLSRCIGFSDAFQEVGLPNEFIVNGENRLEEFIKDKNFKIFDWLKEPEKLYRLINKSDVVLVDSYLAGIDVYNKISNLAGLLVSVDDYNRLDYPSGIIVNGTLNFSPKDYSFNTSLKLLVGVNYQALRKEFWSVGTKEINENMENILITIGGSDVRNLTPNILQILSKTFPGLKKTVIVDESFTNLRRIEEKSDRLTELIFHVHAKDMLKKMQETDIAISAGGQALYEFARVGTPALVIGVAENQLNNIEGWSSVGFIEYLGFWDDPAWTEKLVLGIRKLKETQVRQKKSAIGQKLVDGQGCRRVVKIVLESLANED